MKKVLIIADLSHASPRLPSIVKYFTKFNWEPIVITGNKPESSDQNFRFVLTKFPNNFIRFKKIFGLNPNKGFQEQMGIPFAIRENQKSFFYKLSTALRAIISYPDEHKHWKKYAVKAAKDIIKKEKIDAIISCSSPVTTHLIAHKLNKKYKIPWIADFRDLWTQNHNYHYGCIRKFFEEKLEKKILKRAKILITVSPVWAKKLSALHKKRVYLITNGFDLNLLKNTEKLSNPLTITYTGPIYTGKQNTNEFLDCLKELIENEIINSNDIRVKFYGPKNKKLQMEIEKNDLQNLVKQYGLVPRKTSFKKQLESQLLLLLYWNDPKIKGWYPLKVFEYLAAQRPILVTGGFGGDVVEELISSTHAGFYCKNKEEIKKNLLKFYSEYKQNKNLTCYSNINEIKKYSYYEASKKFIIFLNNLTSNFRL